MTRAGLLAALVVVCALALVPAAGSQGTVGNCPPGTPAPTFTVNGKAGPVYATQELTVRVKTPGDPDSFVETFELSGARLLAEDFQDEGSNALRAIADAPGTLTASAVVNVHPDPEGPSCTVVGSTGFEVKPAGPPIVTKLRLPPPFLADPPLVKDTDYSFIVKPGPTGDRRPLTVEARAVLRARLPGRGVRAKTETFALRESDVVEDRDLGGRCSSLICPKRVRTWPKGPEVNVFDVGGGRIGSGIKVQVTAPRGVPRGRRFVKTPFGVDVRVLQGGRAVARLRIAGTCVGAGQFSDCKYKKKPTTRLR